MLASILGGVLINEIIARQGGWLFRWRSYVLLGFVPFMYLAINQPEPIEVNFGSLADSFYGAVCVTIAFFGLAIRALTVGFVPAENLIGRASLIFFSLGNDTSFREIWKWPTNLRWDRLFKVVE